MRATLSHIRKAVEFKLFVPALLLMLPLLLLGSNLVEASPPLPSTSPTARAGGNAPLPSTLVLRVYFRSTAERDKLAAQLDTLEIPTTGGYLTVLSDRAGLDALVKEGLQVEVDDKQTANLNTTVKFGNTQDNFFGGYHTVEEIQQFLDQEVSAYPTLAEKVDYGDSWCKAHAGLCTRPNPNSGYDLLALHITNQNIPGPKPVLWVEAGIHAREIAPVEIALDYISYLLDNYNSDADAHWLVDWNDIYVIPTINPDGHHIVEAGGGGDNPYYQRKNANFTNGCTTWPPAISNQFGTDINRNFPFLWNCCGGSSADPCAEGYHGPAANSDDETQAVVSKVSSLIPDQRGPDITDPAPITTTGTFLDMHSFADVNLYSWDMYNTPAPNDAELKNLAFHMSATDAFPPGDDYTPCQFGHCLYIADGATNDWVYGELGAAAFAEEIGDTFFPPYTTTQQILWPQNRGMMLYLAKVARMPYLMTRGPDTTLVSTGPMTVTQGISSTLTATVNYAWDYHGGYDNYLQNVAAAEYYLDTPPWAGGTPLPMQPVDGQFDSPTEAVEAAVQTGSIPVGRHILFVRGRGVNSYQGYQSWGPVSATWLTVLPYASPTPTATGTPPTATPTHTPVPTSTPTSTPCAAAAIQNGGFETGSFAPGWTILDTNPTPTVSTAHRHTGGYAAFLGSVPNNEPVGDSSIYQQIDVPASGGTLSFWYYPYSRDNVQFDWQDAYITDVNGNILATIMHVLEGTETWTNVTYSLDAYAGQTIRVVFLVHQDGAGDVTNMYVDDVMLIETCPTSVPSTSTPTGTPTGTPTPRPLYFTEFTIPSSGSTSQYITPGPDGNLWFVETGAGRIGRITTQGQVTEFPLAHSYAEPMDITGGPDGALWFTEYNPPQIPPQIGRITTNGVVTEFPLSPVPMSIYAITAGPDGNLWFPEYVQMGAAGSRRIGPPALATPSPPGPTATPGFPPPYDISRFTPGGAQTRFTVNWATGIGYGITAGPDGNLWWAASQDGAIARITTGGTITEFPLPNGSSLPSRITTGPDGALWFTEVNTGVIGRMTTSGVLAEYPVGVPGNVGDITAGPDGNLWFTDESANAIDCISPSGVLLGRYQIPTAQGEPYGITRGPDGALWFTEYLGNKIGRLSFSANTSTPSPSIPPSMPPSATRTLSPASTQTAATATTAAATVTLTSTPTVCTISFTDVPVGSTFYSYIHCLACLGIINGYPDGTFKPNNDVTRGQLSKIVSSAAGFFDNQTTQMFQDVPVGSTFFQFVGRLASRGFISGYPCGGLGEACVPPANLPYFRPNNNSTRGQISKIVSNAAGFSDTPTGRQFEDVPTGSTYYTYTYRLTSRSVMSGYACRGAGEPCVPPGNLPYFRPNNNATRGQTSKIVANTFFPDCQAQDIMRR